MRQIGSIENRQHAVLFIDFLVSQDISAHAEEEADHWAIWVRDENNLEKSLDELKQFNENPTDPLYQRASADAEARRRENNQRRQAAQKNLVNMRGQWQKGLSRHTPFVFLLIFACVAVTMLNGVNQEIPSGSKAWVVTFMSQESLGQQYELDPGTNDLKPRNPDSLNIFSSIKKGEVWRLVTPIFLHLGFMHLVFNMMWIWNFGSVIEDRIKTIRFVLLVVVIAILSNIAQTMFKSPLFGGISGVNYGLFGFLWMKTLFDRSWSYKMPQLTTILFIAWFFICLSGQAGPVANWAHGVGLVVGVVIGYAPVALRPLGKKSTNDNP